MRRRAFLLAAGLAGTAVAAPNALAADGVEVDPAAFLARRLEGVLLATQPSASGPAPITTLRTVLAAARADFRACRYLELAARLPELITTAETTHQQTGGMATARVGGAGIQHRHPRPDQTGGQRP